MPLNATSRARSPANCANVRGARPELALEQSIERGGAIRRGDRVTIACSGGPDSVALAAALHAIAKPMELTLAIAHVNHGIRASAWQDECVVLRVAATFGLVCDTIGLEMQSRDEATLRDARYEALLASAERAGSNVIATAHHAEDQSETVLLALFRGAGPDGIAGMRARRTIGPGIDLARPLLRCSLERTHRLLSNACASLRRRSDQCRLELAPQCRPRGAGGAAAALPGAGSRRRASGRDRRRRARGQSARRPAALRTGAAGAASTTCATSTSSTSRKPCGRSNAEPAAAFI